MFGMGPPVAICQQGINHVLKLLRRIFADVTLHLCALILHENNHASDGVACFQLSAS
jgi:hypothetical protein